MFTATWFRSRKASEESKCFGSLALGSKGSRNDEKMKFALIHQTRKDLHQSLLRVICEHISELCWAPYWFLKQYQNAVTVNSTLINFLDCLNLLNCAVGRNNESPVQAASVFKVQILSMPTKPPIHPCGSSILFLKDTLLTSSSKDRNWLCRLWFGLHDKRIVKS